MKDGRHIQRMKELNLLNGRGFALNVGSHNGFDSIELKKLGYSVEAVDKKDFPPVDGVTFIQADIVDFPVTKEKYSFILCRNVLPFVKDKKQVSSVLYKLVDGLTSGGIIHFTLFGPNDEWANDPRMSFYDYNEAMSEIKKLPLEIIERVHMEGPVTTMKGEPKHAEIHRFTCRKVG